MEPPILVEPRALMKQLPGKDMSYAKNFSARRRRSIISDELTTI